MIVDIKPNGNIEFDAEMLERTVSRYVELVRQAYHLDVVCAQRLVQRRVLTEHEPDNAAAAERLRQAEEDASRRASALIDGIVEYRLDFPPTLRAVIAGDRNLSSLDRVAGRYLVQPARA